MKTFEEFYAKYPNVAFVKTNREVESPEDLTDDAFIIEEDTPPLEKGFSIIMPLYIEEYPHIFKMATAMEAGLWAIDRCEDEGYEITREAIEGVLYILEKNMEREEKSSKA